MPIKEDLNAFREVLLGVNDTLSTSVKKRFLASIEKLAIRTYQENADIKTQLSEKDDHKPPRPGKG